MNYNFKFVYRVFGKKELEEFKEKKYFAETSWILIQVLFIYLQTTKLKKQSANILKKNKFIL